jgi:long-chain-fatty-acid--CoA ligase ACSBG
MKKSTIEYFASLDMPLLNFYGLSETTGATTAMTADKSSITCAGFTLPGSDLKIDNPDEKGIGEIIMRGRHIMMGYLKNEDATKEVMDKYGFFHSGDLGTFDKDGFLKITGRIKEIIITAGGENVAPIIIEDSLKE